MTVDNKKRTLINILYFAAILFFSYVIIKYVLWWFLPFVISFAVAASVNSPAKKLSSRIGVSKKVCSVSIVIGLYVIIVCLLILCASKLTGEIQQRVLGFPEFYKINIAPVFESLQRWIDDIIVKAAPQRAGNTNTILGMLTEQVGNTVASLSAKTLEALGNFIKDIPNFLMVMFFTIVSSVLIVMDYDRIAEAVFRILPEKAKKTLTLVKEVLVNSVFKMIKAYALMMLLTFAELLVGFVVLGIDNPVIKALLFAFVDFLPLVGLSLIFIPWIILCLIERNFFLAIGLSVMFLIITIIRNFAEPKIVGDQVGLHPVVSLICFYVGLKLMGIWGIFILPLVAVLLKKLNDSDAVTLWKS